MACLSSLLWSGFVAFLDFIAAKLNKIQGEKFVETKKRLQARLGVSDKEIAKYRFAIIQVSTFKQPSYIEDG